MKKFSLFLATLFMSMLMGVSANAQEPMDALDPLVISNLVTEEMTVEDQTYLLLMGSNDMFDSEVSIFLNNYTGEDKEYEVNTESSFLTYGGIELSVTEGIMAQTTVDGVASFVGSLIVSAEEDGEVMVLSLEISMSAAAAVEVNIEDAVARVDEVTGSLLLTAEWSDGEITYPVFLTVAGYEEADYKEYEAPQVSELQIGSDEDENSPWLDFAAANYVVVSKAGSVVTVMGEYNSAATGAIYTVTANGVMQSGEVEPEYPVIEDVISNLVFDWETEAFIGGPSSGYALEVSLVLGEDNFDGSFTLSEESTISMPDQELTFLSGYVYEINLSTPEAKAVVVASLGGVETYEFHLTMNATPVEPTAVVVENATIEVNKYLLFGDTYDYSLLMTGEWVNEADGLTYPVLVEVPVYYPEATEPNDILCSVTVGDIVNDPWFGFGEGEMTITTIDNVVTATGVVSNGSDCTMNVTISGKLPSDETALDNLQVGFKAVKAIKNGQLVISIDNIEYNATGAVVK